MAEKFKLQDYLSFGYLFLLALGIMRDAIYYGFVGINIINYSNILDVLLSPIAYLTESVSVPLILLGIVSSIIWIGKAAPRIHKKYRIKPWYRKLVNVNKTDEMYAKPTSVSTGLIFSAILIAAFYLGSGIGSGMKTAERMKTNDFEMKETITFIDNSVEHVKILGQNSGYIFYVKKNKNSVSITPISGIVKEIYSE
jgi:hypothetical protein